MESCRGSNAMLVLLVPSRATSIDLDHARKVQLMDTLAVSELPDTSMTCAAKRALLDIGQYDRAGKPRRSSPAARTRLGSSDGVGCTPNDHRAQRKVQ